MVRFGDGSEIAAHAIILATGVAYRTLEAPGVAELTGRGVYYGSAMTQGPSCAGEEVYIVGGANSAGQAAVFFSRYARMVTLLVRGASLRDSMSHYLVKQLDAIGNIAVRTGTVVGEAHGTEHLEQLTVCDRSSGRGETVPAGAPFVFIGAAPRTDWLGEAVLRDSRGFVLTGPTCSSTVTGPRGGPSSATPTTWSPACRECWWPATPERSR